jgi:hypothetical protein
VKRRKLIKTTTVGAVALVLGEPKAALLETSEHTPVPHRVGASDIEQIRTVTRMFASWDFTYGSGLVQDAAMAQLRYSASVLDESVCPERLCPELYSAVGDLADTAAFIAFDAGAPEEARRVFRFGLYCAEQSKDWNLRAKVLSGMTVLEISAGQPDEGLTLAELSLVRPDRLTATGLALVHSTRGRALAKMRRVQETLRAIGTAEEHFAHATPDNDPPYLAYYNAAHLTRRTSEALFDLAILGHHPEQASTRLATAAAEYAIARARARTTCLAKLASLTMVAGDPHQAATIGHEALDIAGTIRSRRTLDDLRELSRYAAAHQNLEEVANLRQRIGTLLLPTDSP